MGDPLPLPRNALTSRQLIARAKVAHQRGQLGEAKELYLRALHKLPDLFEAQHSLGVLLSQQGHHDEALALVEAALKTDPDSVEALTNHGLILHKMNRHEAALVSFNKALALRPDHAWHSTIEAPCSRLWAATRPRWKAISAH